MNPADHVDDDPVAVGVNRERLAQALELPAGPTWLRQVHGTRVVEAQDVTDATRADASYAHQPGVVCAVLTADCLPVLLSDRDGRCVAAVHAGWRGLAAGVIEQTVRHLQAMSTGLLAWLGPAIGPQAFVVGEEVRDIFMAHDPRAADAFLATPAGALYADLYQLARQRLAACGVSAVYGGQWCTCSDAERFYSFRRDGMTGRMASLIWLASK
jgi:YfiH family protein